MSSPRTPARRTARPGRQHGARTRIDRPEHARTVPTRDESSRARQFAYSPLCKDSRLTQSRARGSPTTTRPCARALTNIAHGAVAYRPRPSRVHARPRARGHHGVHTTAPRSLILAASPSAASRVFNAHSAISEQARPRAQEAEDARARARGGPSTHGAEDARGRGPTLPTPVYGGDSMPPKCDGRSRTNGTEACAHAPSAQTRKRQAVMCSRLVCAPTTTSRERNELPFNAVFALRPQERRNTNVKKEPTIPIHLEVPAVANESQITLLVGVVNLR